MMSRLFLKLVLLITLVLTATSLVARFLGSIQLPNPLFDGFRMGCEGKPQPCWHGILIGKVRVEEAVSRLNKLDYITYTNDLNFVALENIKTPLCKINLDYNSDGIVEVMRWGNCENVRCGDFYTFLSQPNHTVLEGACRDPRTHEKSLARLLFAELLSIWALSCGRVGLPSC